jgi:curli biogenesis system outer membrane secretion channel CsgG
LRALARLAAFTFVCSSVAGVATPAAAQTAPAAAPTKSTRPTVAVLNFEYGTIQRWWSHNQDIGEGISDMIVDELVNDGSYRVIERRRLDAVLAEQNFSNSERADPSAKTLAEIGKALGVKYLIVGSVTKFGTEQSNRSFGGGGYGSAFGLGQVGTAKGKANVAITARMIDTTTGEILASAKGDGTSKRSGLLLGGAGGGGGGGGGGRIEFGASNFNDTILGEATEAAVKATAAKLIAAKNRIE